MIATDCHITIASTDDKHAVLQCWKQLTIELPQYHAKPFGTRLTENIDQELGPTIEQCILREDAQVWLVLSKQGKVLGTVAVVLNTLVGYSQPNSGVIFNLWLLPEARGVGLGQRLVDEAKDWLRSKGATSIQAGWHPSNIQADRFWKKQGFESYETIAAKQL